MNDEKNLGVPSNSSLEQIFAGALEAFPDAVVLRSLRTGTCVAVNREFERLSGYRREDVVGRTLGELDLWPDHGEFDDALAELVRDGSIRNREISYRTRAGELRHGLVSASVVELGEERYALAFGRDVTDRKRAEERLRESEQRLRLVIGSAPLLLFAVDSSGVVTMLEGNALATLGLRSEEVVGHDALPVFQDSVEAEAVTRHAMASQPFTVTSRFGGRVWEVSVVPAFDSEGKPDGGIGVAVDATEKVQAEELRRDFVAMLSHDIKTPLTAALGFVSLLREPTADEAERIDFVDRVDASVQQAMSLAMNIVDVARIESGKLDLTRGSVSLNEIAHHVIRHQESRARSRRIRVEATLAVDLPDVSADLVLVDRAVANLLSNALKFSPEGSHVMVSTDVDEGRVVLRIADEGPGVSPEERPRLFTRYAPGARAERSTGLGLFIVRTVVEAHGGEVGVEPRPGGGSVFWMTLPTRPDAGV
jgi:PAS domain S-box-containing protein